MKPKTVRDRRIKFNLRDQSLFLQDFLDALTYPVWVINTENYLVEMANTAACHGELKDGLTCYQLLHGTDKPCTGRDHPCPLLESRVNKKPAVIEHLHVNMAGALEFVEVHYNPILDEAGNVTHMIVQSMDITQRKQFEQALQESEANWRSLTETSPDHLLMLDRDLNIRFANFASPGLTVEKLIGTPLFTYVEEERQAEIKAILEGVLESGLPAQYETVYHTPGGSDIYYETYVTARRLPGRNEIIGLTLASRDITRRVQTDREKQALTHSLGERFKELGCLYNISKLIMTPDVSLDEIIQGTVSFIPPAMQYPEITYARVKLEEMDYRTENYRESLWILTADIYVYTQKCGTVEVGYLEEKPVVGEGPFLPEERNLIEAIAESLGKTAERLRSEERIRQNELQLAALEERERIGRELHDDLGQVISYVGAQARAAKARLEQGENQEVRAILDQLIRITQEAYADVRQYILGIRKSSHATGERSREGQPAPDFLTILEGYLEALHERYGLETQVSLPADWSDSLLASEVETQLLRIIQEALTNVGKHADVDKARLLFTQRPEGVQVIIADEGRGFAVSHPKKGSAGQGETHFGLTIMRERAEIVGGRLEVRSNPGEGTRIIVHLPHTLPQTQTIIGKSVRVLLVDDHPLYLEGLRSLLASRGFQVIGTAPDGLQAQSLARLLRPDLILMDVHMPHCDGLEATKNIKEALPDTKIVLLTVAAEGDTLFEALKYGASGYLLKSLEGNQFFNLLANVLDGQTTLSPEMATMVLEEFAYQEREPASKASKEVTLTSRQNEVLALTAQGLSNKEIARKLHITEATVKYHVSQILDRLHLKSRYQLSQYSPQKGFPSPQDGE